jgi:hypothetical protein
MGLGLTINVALLRRWPSANASLELRSCMLFVIVAQIDVQR